MLNLRNVSDRVIASTRSDALPDDPAGTDRLLADLQTMPFPPTAAVLDVQGDLLGLERRGDRFPMD